MNQCTWRANVFIGFYFALFIDWQQMETNGNKPPIDNRTISQNDVQKTKPCAKLFIFYINSIELQRLELK